MVVFLYNNNRFKKNNSVYF